MTRLRLSAIGFSAAVVIAVFCGGLAMQAAQRGGTGRGWEKGKGWGWIWGKEDEVGSLNAMNDGSRLAAIKLAKQGKVYDLGITYDRTS